MRPHLNFFLLAIGLLPAFLQAQPVPATSREKITDLETVPWKGFDKVTFKMNGVPAWYIEPHTALPGNPWVWRARFPDWHTATDSILLQKGFHIAYINTNALFGAPAAMMIWDDFYDYLVHQEHFAAKVALEGVSRGGLFVYGWAKRNPARVSCIYGEAPVCDFKSWPAGKGTGKGSPADWQKLLASYGYTEARALHDEDQPKDHLEGLAAYKVPVLHAIGLNDEVVPPAENTLPLVHNYILDGGPATVIPMTRGPQALQGHHFTIEDPSVPADFIMRHTLPVAQPLPPADFIHFYGKPDNALFRIEKEKKATVAFLGGSITHMKGWRDKVIRYLQELFPHTDFHFISAGIPSLGSVPHAFRLQQDVLDSGRIDLLFIESAVNDQVNGTPAIQQERALEGIIRHAYASNPDMDMVLMAFADEEKIADYQAGKIPPEVAVHEKIAQYYHLPFINLAEEVAKKIQAGEFTWQYDFKSIHPAPFGQELYFAAIKTLLRDAFRGRTVDQLTAATGPAPIQKENYSLGKYLPVSAATRKKSFSIDASWEPADSVHTRPGFVQVPMLVGDSAGASFNLPFSGTAVGIAVVSGPDAGMIEYSVDRQRPKTMDLYTRWSAHLHLPWYLILGDGLKDRKHLLHVRILPRHAEGSKGRACRIVHFLVNGR